MVNREKIIKKILRSAEFKESKRIQDILKYLIKASENDQEVKESTIAADLFGRNSSFDPHEDPIIRVYMSKLRKKLHYYYITEGKNDKFKIEIPKGQYHVQFVRSENLNEKFKINYKLLSYFFFILSIIFLSILLLGRQKPVNKNFDAVLTHPFWTELIKESKNPTLIVLGDYFFLFQRKPGVEEGYFVRDPEINSADEFKQAIKIDPQLTGKFTICNFSYLGPFAAESLMLLFPFLSYTPNKIFLKLASELKWDEINRSNIIYIGPLKTLYELKKIFTRLPIRFKIVPPELNLLGENADTIKTFHAMRKERTTYKNDYGIILKQKGPNDNVILFFTGFDELGIKEAIKYSTTPEFKQLLEDNVSTSNYNSFYLFIEVEGVDRTIFKSEVKHFQSLSADYSGNF